MTFSVLRLLPFVLVAAHAASLEPGTFADWQQKGVLAGIRAQDSNIPKILGKKTPMEWIVKRSFRFAVPPGGDIDLVEIGTAYESYRMALSAPGRATFETAPAEIAKLGKRVVEAWAWYEGLGLVYTTEEKFWFGVFDPATGRLGLVNTGIYPFVREGQIVMRSKLDASIDSALSNGQLVQAESLLVFRSGWFGPSAERNAALADRKLQPAVAITKPAARLPPPGSDPLRDWSSLVEAIRTATPEEAELFDSAVRVRHAAAVTHLQGQISRSTSTGSLASTAARQRQLAALLGETDSGTTRTAAEKSLRAWLSKGLVLAPPPGATTAISLNWSISALNTTVATLEDAMRMTTAASVVVGPLDTAGIGSSIENGTITIKVPNVREQQLAESRASKIAEIEAAKIELAEGLKEMERLERSAGSGSEGSAGYGRTERSYNNDPDNKDVYKDRYVTKVHKSATGPNITPQMRVVDLKISGARETIRLRSQELENLPPSSGPMEFAEERSVQKQRWRGKVRRTFTLMKDGMQVKVPVEVDLSAYSFSKHGQILGNPPRDEWKSRDEVLKIALAELERKVAKEWPATLRKATLARLSELAGQDSVEARWGRLFFEGSRDSLSRNLDLPSLVNVQELRARRAARKTSNILAVLAKPSEPGVDCGPAPLLSTDGRRATWCGALYDAETGRRLRQLTTSRSATARFSEDGKTVEIHDREGSKLQVWSAMEGHPISERKLRSNSEVSTAPSAPHPAQFELRIAGNPDRVEIRDRNWVAPRTHDYLLTFANGTPLSQFEIRIDKGASSGIRLHQIGKVLSKDVAVFDESHWTVKEVTDSTAVVWTSSYSTGISNNNPIRVVVMGRDFSR